MLQEHVTTVAQRDQKTFAYNPTQERNFSRSTEKNRKMQLLLALIISSALHIQCYRIKGSENENKPFAPYEIGFVYDGGEVGKKREAAKVYD